MSCYLVCLIIFFLLYYGMLWFILAWALMAAVLNPSTYLPYAAAAITFFATISAKILIYQVRYEQVYKNYDKIISEKLDEIVNKSLSKIKSFTKDKLKNTKLPIDNDAFHK